MGALSRPARVAAAVVLAACAGCSSPPRTTAIGGGWYIDEVPAGHVAPHLYYETRNKERIVVDRQIESYRLYANRCVIYESPRPNGRFLFVTWGSLTPVAFRTSVGMSRWRLDVDGPRRFETPVDPDGRRLLQVDWINFGDACYLAQLQPRFHEGWQKDAPFDEARVKSEQKVIEVDGEDSVGNTVLSDAAIAGKVVLVDELVRAGADVNSANRAGISTLMLAVASGNIDVVRRLVQAGARVNAQSGGGETALMYAARYQKFEIAKFLIDNGANVRLRDDSGRTAAVWLPDRSSNEVRQLRALLDDPHAR